MKNIHEFVSEDQKGHIERSGEEIRSNACRSSELSLAQRRDFFYGLSVVFPMMLLSHYYTWSDENDETEYMEILFRSGKKSWSGGRGSVRLYI
jgi:hypothetical protein